MEVLIGFGFAIGIVTLIAVLRGFVTSYLWYWFLVPFGLPAITVSHAIGLALLVGMFTQAQKSDTDKMDLDDALKVLFTHGILAPLFVLLVGYIVHRIMV